jgi:hypothetical protein
MSLGLCADAAAQAVGFSAPRSPASSNSPNPKAGVRIGRASPLSKPAGQRREAATLPHGGKRKRKIAVVLKCKNLDLI